MIASHLTRVRHSDAKPDPQEVIGHWIATDATLQDLARGPYKEARLVIAPQLVLRFGDPDEARGYEFREAG